MHTPATETPDGREQAHALPRYDVCKLTPPEQAIWRRLGFPVPPDIAAAWARQPAPGGDVGPCRRRVRTPAEVAYAAERNRKNRAARAWARRKATEKKARAAA